MKKFIRIAVSALSIATAGGLTQGQVNALPLAPAAELAIPSTGAENAAFLFNRRRYCWYALGWRGEGWYRCGYRLRRGYGWGGGDGWQGWSAPVQRQRPMRVNPGYQNPGIDRPGMGTRPYMGTRPVGRPARPMGEGPGQTIDPAGPRGGGVRPAGPRPAGPRPGGVAPVGGANAAPPAMPGPRGGGPIGQPARPPAAAPGGGGGGGGAPAPAPAGDAAGKIYH